MNVKRLIYYFLLIVCLGIFVMSSGNLIINYYNEKKENELASEGIADAKLSPSEQVKELQEKYNNKDIVGIITIKGTNINHAFVKTTNNSYYLSHTLSKEKSKIGAVFMDYRNSFDDRQINIYGHNSNRYDVAFKELIKFKDIDFIKENDEIEITNMDEVLKYKIVFVKRSKSEEHMNIKFKNKKAWNNHIKEMRKNALYDTKESITWNDNIIVIQTCLLKDGGNYLTITAKREV